MRPADVARGEASRVWGPLVFVAVTLAVALRLGFGVDLTDEGYYAALPWSVLQGHAPIVDEWAVHQLAGLLILPFVRLWVAVAGSSEGLVLFLRCLYLGTAVAAALTARTCLARIVGPRFAWPAAAILVAWVPFHIPALSYNTIATLGFTTGVLLLGRAITARAGAAAFATATGALAVASFAYPTMLAPSCVALGGAVLAEAWTRDRHDLRRIVAGIAGPACACAAATAAWVVSLGGPHALHGLQALDTALAAQGGGTRKLGTLAIEALAESDFATALLVWLTCLVLLVVRSAPDGARVGGCVALGVAPWLIHELYRPITEPFTTAPFYWSALACAAPVLVHHAAGRVGAERRMAQWLVVVAGLVGGAVVLWSTANGLRNAALGLMPAALVAAAMVAEALARVEPAETAPSRSGSAAAAVLLAGLLVFQLAQLWERTYRNGPVADLTATMSEGPWRGLRTTPDRAAFLGQLSQELEAARGDASTWIVYDYLPGAYLLTDLRPLTHALWTFPGFCCQGTPDVRQVYARRFAGDAPRPDLVLENRCMLIEDGVMRPDPPPGYEATDPLRTRLARARYRVVARHPCYTIRVRTDAAPGRGRGDPVAASEGDPS